jgi:predicted amidohydrolase YtcJ
LFKNAKIYTVEGKNWEEKPASFLVVDDEGKINYVDISPPPKLYDNTDIIDLKGKTVLPGFIDTHVHLPGNSLISLFEIYLYDTRTRDECLNKIREFIKNNPGRNFYYGDGFHMHIAPDGILYKEWLDEISDDKPIVIKSADGHTAWLNTKAFEVFGIKNQKQFSNPSFLPLNDKGEPIGMVLEEYSLINYEPEYTKEELSLAITDFQEKMLSWGYTSMMLIAPNFMDIGAFFDFYKTGKWKIKVNLSEKIFVDDDEDEVLEKANLFRKKFRDHKKIRFETIKVFADGVIEGGTAFLKEPYANKPDSRGKFLWKNEERFQKILEKITRNNFQFHIHTIGDAATEKCLDLMDKINIKEFIRPVFTHLQLISKKDIKRMADYNVICAHQPFWHFKEPSYYEKNDLFRLGEKRALECYPVRDCLNAKMKITFSGDFPVSTQNHPFYAIKAAVTRNLYAADYFKIPDTKNIDDEEYLRNKNQRISLKDAIEAYTINAAYQLFREDEIGSLSPAKKADFIILNKDPFRTKKTDLDKIKILATYIDGEKIK